jgi:3-oxosteroid 1-dehydrogenase
MLVNRRGRRFADEAFYPAVGAAVEIADAIDKQPANFPCWIVQDAQFGRKYPFGSFMPGQELPEEIAFRADSLEEVAEKAGIDPVGLVDEVARLNAFAEEGVDHDFGRGDRPWSHLMCGDPKGSPKNPNLAPLTEPPFYAVPVKMIGTGISSTGLEADRHGAVIDYDGEPIPGLYAAGNSVAQRDVGAGYQSGLANGRGLVFGHLAARHAAKGAS